MTIVSTQVHPIDSTLASFTLPKAITVGKRCDLELEDCETENETWLEEGESQSNAYSLAAFTLPTAIRLGKRYDLSLEECETDKEHWLEDKSRWTVTAPALDALSSFSKVSTEEISEGARNLLLLTSFCEGPFPEEIIEILWTRMEAQPNDLDSMASFREELERHKWLDVKSHRILLWSVAGSKKSRTLCSVQQQYVKTFLKIERKVLFKNLFEGTGVGDQKAGIVQDRETISISVCALYFEKPLAANTVAKLGLSPTRLSELKKIRAWIVQPLLWLLQNINTKDWFGSSGIAMKVFLSYMSCEDDEHDKEVIRLLLALPCCRETTCWTLIIVALITQRLLMVTEKYTEAYEQNSLKALVDLVAGQDWSKKPEDTAGWALANVRSKDHHKVVMAALPGLVEGLVGSLARISYPFVTICSLMILADLALESRYTVRRKIFEFPDALPALMELLSKEECYTMQSHAASVLERLALDSSIAKSLGELPSVSKELVDVIFRAKSRSLQSKVAAVLSIIAVVQDHNLRSIRIEVLESPGVLTALVKLLCEAEDRNTQSQAALTLAMLSTDEKDSASTWKKSLCTNKGLASKMADILVYNPDAFLQLVLLLYEDEAPEVQGNAGRVLNNLSSCCEKLRQEFIQGIIPGYDNVIVDQLVKILNNNRNSYAQIEAARLLAVVGDASDDHEFVIGIKLANEPKVLPKLAMLMHSKETPVIPQLVTVLFYFTARAMHKESVSMAPMEEAKEGLLNLLTTDQHTGSGRSPYISAYALTLLDPIKAGTLSLHSEDAFEGRADALAKLKMYPTTPEHNFAALDLASTVQNHHTLRDEFSRPHSRRSSKLWSRRQSNRDLGYAETDTELEETSSGRRNGRTRKHFSTLMAARLKLFSFSRKLKSFGAGKNRNPEIIGNETPLWQPVRSLMRGSSILYRKSKLGENGGTDTRAVSRASSRAPSFRVVDFSDNFASSREVSRIPSRTPSRLPSCRVLDFPGRADFPLSIPVSPYRLAEYESVTNSPINVQCIQR